MPVEKKPSNFFSLFRGLEGGEGVGCGFCLVLGVCVGGLLFFWLVFHFYFSLIYLLSCTAGLE